MEFSILLVIILIINANFGKISNTKTTETTAEEGDPDTEVEVEQGKVLGRNEDGENGLKFISYQNIPYAKKPEGDLRFKDPIKAESWGTFNAVGSVVKCPQLNLKNEIVENTNEDCLRLNVYKPKREQPKTETAEKLPVMVFIHGGSFTSGDSGRELYGPEFLLTKDVIVVTINYRLGILGFFHLQDSTEYGNAGLKDQKLALEWIQQNIGSFGGDPDKVTIFGQSAGGASVHFHVLSKKSEGLFHRAIIESGSAIAPWVNGLVDNGAKLAEKLELTTDNVNEIVQQLQALPVDELLEGEKKLRDSANLRWGSPGNPVVEAESSTAFLTKDPYKIIANNEYNDVPLLIGYNDNEGIAMEQRLKLLGQPIVVDFLDLIPDDLNKVDESNQGEVTDELKNFYFPNDEEQSNITSFHSIYTDSWFAYPVYRTAREHLKHSKSPIYFYRFSASSELNVYKNQDSSTKDHPGASHCDELGYLFKTDRTNVIASGSEEETAMKKMVELWTNFTINGKPSGDGSKWPKLNSTFEYLEIGLFEDDSVMEKPDGKRMEFWDGIYARYSSNARIVFESPLLIYLVLALNGFF